MTQRPGHSLNLGPRRLLQIATKDDDVAASIGAAINRLLVVRSAKVGTPCPVPIMGSGTNRHQLILIAIPISGMASGGAVGVGNRAARS